MPLRWIQNAIKKPGALRKALGAKKDKPIPPEKLEKAAEGEGKGVGPKTEKRARLAETLKSLRRA